VKYKFSCERDFIKKTIRFEFPIFGFIPIMDEIIEQLRQSITDEVLSKGEKKSLKERIAHQTLTADDVNFLRSRIYEIAHEKATQANYSFIIDWIRNANSFFIHNSHKENSKAYFSPGEACREAIIHEIRQAVSHLNICVFTISDDRISEAILGAHRRKVDIKILTDNDKAFDLGSDITRFFKEGLIVKIDNTTNHMHHKFMIADGRTLITGSYNWTNSAARYNQENVIVTNEPSLIKSFQHEFDRLWNVMDLYK
jgi:cardiolipin hydrolase